MIKTIDCNNLKFRGLEYKTDKVIAGDTVLIEKGEVSIIFDADGNPHEMLPDSVKHEQELARYKRYDREVRVRPPKKAKK